MHFGSVSSMRLRNCFTTSLLGFLRLVHYYVFVWMTRQGHLPMVIQLMRYGADPSVADGEGYRALHLAILFQHMAIAAYLIAKGQVRHTHHFIPHSFSLQHFCFHSFSDYICFSLCASCGFVSQFLRCLQEVDGPDCNGQTPLMLAAQKIIG